MHFWCTPPRGRAVQEGISDSLHPTPVHPRRSATAQARLVLCACIQGWLKAAGLAQAACAWSSARAGPHACFLCFRRACTRSRFGRVRLHNDSLSWRPCCLAAALPLRLKPYHLDWSLAAVVYSKSNVTSTGTMLTPASCAMFFSPPCFDPTVRRF